ncbi:MAG: cytochrome d ubiquinol oxidase subunit II, partial [Acidobacteriaceae bacterium]|nr:cytochrome d ubiquinol oxidase subunit II [Acidobacteriaceae bacterium]
ASSFSGFYLPLMMVLWLLILRALSLEMRGRIGDSVIRSFCSGTFFVSSALLAIFYGAAFANVLRGVPLAADGTFFLPMWTNWRPGADPGILDWYTVLGGVLALCALAMHGLLYLVMKTDGPMQAASRRWARNILPAVFLLTIVGIPATVAARPDSLHNYANHSILWVFPAIVLLSLVSIGVSLAKRCEVSAFLSSCVYLAMMMVSAVIGVYPVVLPSVAGHGPDITIERALTSPQALRMGLVWWVIGILLAAFYFVTIYWIFRGKVSEHSEGYGH